MRPDSAHDHARGNASAAGRIGFGGGCHWCTEAVFAALRGVHAVEQGWVAPRGQPDAFSEAIILRFDPDQIPLQVLIDVHLHTHACTSYHGLRERYRSAIYVFDDQTSAAATAALQAAQAEFDPPIITKVLPFGRFRASPPRYQNYYAKDPAKPFCQRHISPKLARIRAAYPQHVRPDDSAGTQSEPEART